jgi:hypothetical protein
MTLKLQGRCLCGSIRFEAELPPLWSCFCHCESCRRNTSSPLTAFLGFHREQVQFAGRRPNTYHSTAGVTRSFCGACGSPVAFESLRWPGEIHLYAAGLEDPGQFVPQYHVHWSEKLPWLMIDDGLPKYPQTS